jgi:hypothetical protein
VSIADLRAAQAGYVATGQAPGAWMTRATEAFDRVTRGLEARKAAAPNADARAKYEAALKSVANLGSIDSRVRESIAQEDRLHAGDLIFIDAQQTADTAQSELTVARAAEEQAATQRTSRLSMMRLGMNGLAIVFITIIALYFGRSLSILGNAPASSTAQMIKDLPPPVKGTATLNLSSPQPASAAATAAPATTSPPAAGSATDLVVSGRRALRRSRAAPRWARRAGTARAHSDVARREGHHDLGRRHWRRTPSSLDVPRLFGKNPYPAAAAPGRRRQRDVAGVSIDAGAGNALARTAPTAARSRFR